MAPWAPYALALALPALTLALRLAFGFQAGDPPAPLLFILAILACAHAGGLGPALTATVCSVLLLDYFLLAPLHSFVIDSPLHRLQSVVLLLAGVLIGLLQSRFADANARFRGLVDQSVAGIYIIHGDYFSYVNPAFAALFGYDSPRDIIDRIPFSGLVAPADRDKVMEQVRLRASGTVSDVHYEFKALRRDGSVIDVEVHGRRFQGQAAVIGILLDVTERNKLAEALRRQQAHLEEAVAARTQDLDLALAEVRRSEARYHAVFAGSKVPMLLIDPHGGAIVEANQAACIYYGYDRERFCRLGIGDLNILGAEEIQAEMARADQEKRHQFFFRHRLANGEVRDVEVYSGPLEIDGRHMLYSIVHDISDRVRAEQKLRDLNRDFVTLLENTSDYIYFKDQDSRFRFCSQTLARLTGHPRWQDMIGKHDREVFPPDMAQIYSEEEVAIFAKGQPLLDRIDPYLDERGQPGWVSTNKWPVWDDARRHVVGLFGISRIVTERMRMEAELREMATTDALTGLANRRQFLARLEQQLAGMRRMLMPHAAVLMLDLDHFKHVNDAYGHGVGDAVLRHVAEVMRSCMRKIDVAGRMGGEEFAFLLPGSDLEAARSFAERLRQAVADSPLDQDGVAVPVTVSIGIASLEATDDSVDVPLARADQALYAAKNQGRNRVVLAPPAKAAPMLLAAPDHGLRAAN